MLLTEKINRIKGELQGLLKNGKSLFTSSSFQTHSIPLLHLISEVDRSIPVYFLNTGFHFAETMQFRKDVSNKLGLNLIDLSSDIEKIHQKDEYGRFYFSSDTNYCCHLNKVMPMEAVLMEHDIWIAGVRADQNSHRANLDRFEEGKHNSQRYHPILDWSSKDIYEYRMKHDLPAHPLESEGYLSIGCEPCTSKFLDEGRSGRWSGTKKDECGLHIDLVKK